MGTRVRELLVRGGHLFDGGGPVLQADILLGDGLIVEVAPHIDARDGEVLDGRGKIVMPGLINAHTHSNQAIEKGLCDRYPLDAWMVIASYGGANAELGPRDLYVSAMIGAIEMIRTGSTSVLDMPRVDLSTFAEGGDAIMQAYADIGMRAAVAVAYTDLNFASSLPLELVPGMLETLKPRRTARIEDIIGCLDAFITRWSGRNRLLRPMIGPSSLPRCSTELFEASVDLARRRGVGLQTHLLSGKSQVFVGRQRYGGSTVQFLDRIGALADWASYAHSIWLDDDEVRLFGGTPAVAVHNPMSNLKLGAGLAPIPALRKAGAHIALGSDGASSADSQNMFETIKGAAISHRVNHAQEDWILAEHALDMCWSGGAAAMRQPLGRLVPGSNADLVLLHRKGLFLAPAEQLAGQIVHSECGTSVDTVIIDGEVVYRDGKFLRIDESAIRAEAEEIARRVYAGLPDRMRRFEEVSPLFRELERSVNQAELHFSRYCG
jgi:5-methylthioadenosine/S-adenosylhomocysteine deaminase